MKRLILCQIVVVLILITASTYGQSGEDYWPTWRGPNNMGISPKGNPPLKWSELENIKWKVKLTGDSSNSSPIIWEDKIFFQAAVKTDRKGDSSSSGGSDSGRGPRVEAPTNVYKFNIVCLDRNSGKQMWETTVTEAMPHQGHHEDHGFASFSPVTDGKYVWASFGSRGMYCCDLDGVPIWSKDLVKMKTRFGEGSSPALAGDAVVVVVDNEEDSYIYAFEKNTGELLWKKERDEPTSYATPIVVENNGELQVIVSATNRIRSYDVKTGNVVWECGGQTRNVIPSPVLGFGMVFCTSGFRGSALQAIKLGRTGDLTGTDAIAWEVKEATPYVPSPLLYEGKIYVLSVNDAILSCYNAETGKPYYVKKELEQIEGVYASPVAAADRIYIAGRNGVTYVIKPSEELEVLSINKLDDGFDCSPAFVDNEMYLKGKQYLYCIANSED
ncbi:MAG: outer membrane protein assembly factor BamB family protein [Planctomycetota bacterium]|jgi:outer membrane protein assembly factor BamB